MVGSWTISSLKFTPIKPVKKESRITTIKKKNKTKCFTLLRFFFPTCDDDPHIFQFFILVLASCLSRGSETACSQENKDCLSSLFAMKFLSVKVRINQFLHGANQPSLDILSECKEFFTMSFPLNCKLVNSLSLLSTWRVRKGLFPGKRGCLFSETFAPRELY